MKCSYGQGRVAVHAPVRLPTVEAWAQSMVLKKTEVTAILDYLYLATPEAHM